MKRKFLRVSMMLALAGMISSAFTFTACSDDDDDPVTDTTQTDTTTTDDTKDDTKDDEQTPEDTPEETVTAATVTTESATAAAGEDITIAGTNLSMVTSVLLGETEVTATVSEDGTSFTFTVPEGTEAGEATITINTKNSKDEAVQFTVPATITAAETPALEWPILFEGSNDLGVAWSGENAVKISGDQLANVTTNSVLKISYVLGEYVDPDHPSWGTNCSIQFMTMNEAKEFQKFTDNTTGNPSEWNTISISGSSLNISFSESDLAEAKANGWIINGYNVTITKVEYVKENDPSAGTVIYEPETPIALAWGDGNTNNFNVTSVPTLKGGETMTFTYTVTEGAEYTNLKLFAFDADWGWTGLSCNPSDGSYLAPAVDGTEYSVEISEEDATNINLHSQFAVQGCNLSITKITVK